MQRSWSWKRSISPCALGRRLLDCLRRDTNMSYQRKQISNAVHTVSLFVPGSKRPLLFTRVKPQKPLYCSGTSSKWAVLSGKHHSHELISDSTRSSETDKHTCVWDIMTGESHDIMTGESHADCQEHVHVTQTLKERNEQWLLNTISVAIIQKRLPANAATDQSKSNIQILDSFHLTLLKSSVVTLKLSTPRAWFTKKLTWDCNPIKWKFQQMIRQWANQRTQMQLICIITNAVTQSSTNEQLSQACKALNRLRPAFLLNNGAIVTRDHKTSLKSLGIFVAIAKNTLYGSKLLIFLLCQK